MPIIRPDVRRKLKVEILARAETLGIDLDNAETQRRWDMPSRSTRMRILSENSPIDHSLVVIQKLFTFVGWQLDPVQCLGIYHQHADEDDLITIANWEYLEFSNQMQRTDLDYKAQYIEKQFYVLSELYRGNPKGFFMFKDGYNQLRGSMVMVPLREVGKNTIAADFLNGSDTTESDIRAQHIHPMGDRTGSLVYIESLFISGLMGLDRIDFIQSLLNNIDAMMALIVDPQCPDLKLSALGVGHWAGLDEYGFIPYHRFYGGSSAPEIPRRDGRKMYVCSYSAFRQQISIRLERLRKIESELLRRLKKESRTS